MTEMVPVPPGESPLIAPRGVSPRVTLTDVLRTALVVAASAELEGAGGELAPGSECVVSVDCDLGLVEVRVQVPAPLRPHGQHEVLMARAPERFVTDPAAVGEQVAAVEDAMRPESA